MPTPHLPTETGRGELRMSSAFVHNSALANKSTIIYLICRLYNNIYFIPNNFVFHVTFYFFHLSCFSLVSKMCKRNAHVNHFSQNLIVAV